MSTLQLSRTSHIGIWPTISHPALSSPFHKVFSSHSWCPPPHQSLPLWYSVTFSEKPAWTPSAKLSAPFLHPCGKHGPCHSFLYLRLMSLNRSRPFLPSIHYATPESRIFHNRRSWIFNWVFKDFIYLYQYLCLFIHTHTHKYIMSICVCTYTHVYLYTCRFNNSALVFFSH